MFAGLFTVILIGLLVESVIFRDDRKADGAALGHAEPLKDITTSFRNCS